MEKWWLSKSRSRWLILIANKTFRLGLSAGYGSHGVAIIRPRAIVVLPVGARLHGLSLLSFRLFPRRRTTYALAFVPPTSFYTRTSVFRFYGLDGSDSFLFHAPTGSSTTVIYLLTQPHTWRPMCVHALSGHNAGEI